MNNQSTKTNEIKDLINVVKEQDKEYKKIRNKKIGNIVIIVITISTIIFTISYIHYVSTSSYNFCGGGYTGALYDNM